MFNDTVENLQLTYEEAKFLVALLKVNNQTALQLLNAEHLYKPRLLPKLQKLEHMLKKGIAEVDPD
jgi:hypothetical protein|nr:unnamed protein product [uncultured Mediterranean phage uvMED]BAR25836.1 unnamed protein product [uncultured Mediterranean phage uvMED]